LVVDLSGGAVPGLFDEEKLDRVVGNLLDNAFKFTPPGGTVTLTLTNAVGWATIEVEDTGPGIRAEDLPHVFDRFFRGGQEAEHVPGTGIGLALAREYVELHGGEIRAENRPGGGARFVVRLKTATADANAVWATDGPAAVAASILDRNDDGDEASAGAPALEESTAPDLATVLVVDDNADLRTYLRKHLAPHYRVLEAARGDEGLTLLRAEIPDAIVCDVMMPGMDGYAFCRAVKSDPDTDFLPVILLTAKANSEGRIEGLEGGADDYITKPFEPAELLVRISNLLRSRERLRARYAAHSDETALLATPRHEQSVDEVLLAKLRGVLDQSAHEEAFDVQALAAGAGMSRAQLHRRVKEAFGSTPAEMIIRYRLERAAQMLAHRAGNVGEVAYAVGFKNISHFVKRFREHYGQTPAAYATTCLNQTGQSLTQ
jgi:DNA-binding response OmpR family regulator